MTADGMDAAAEAERRFKAGLRARTLAVAREAAPKPRPLGLREYLVGSPSRTAVAGALSWWHLRLSIDGAIIGRPPFGVKALAPALHKYK